MASANFDLTELVHRAESALDSSPITGQGELVVSFDELPVS
jgi:hypothetical protein